MGKRKEKSPSISETDVELGEVGKKPLIEGKKKAEKMSIKKLLQIIQIIGPIWALVFLAAFFNAATGVSPLLFYLTMGDLIDAFSDPANLSKEIANLAFKMLGIAAGSGLATFFYQVFVCPGSEYLASRLKSKYMGSVVRQEIGFFDANKTGSLLSNISEETQLVKTGFCDKIAVFSQFASQGVVGLILGLVYSWKMALVMLACAPVLVVALGIQGKIAAVFQRKNTTASEESTTVAEEVISSFRTVRAFAGEEKESRRFNDSLRPIRRLGVYNGLLQGAGLGFVFFCIWGVCALAFWYGSELVIKGEISVGDLLRVFGMMLFASMGMAQAMGTFPDFAKAMSASATLVAVINRQPKIPFEGGKKLDKIEGYIDFEGVEFTYPTREGQVLFGIDAKILPGETVALVGSSGSGKSTFISLVERFYEPHGGVVKIDGHDITTLDPRWLHDQLGIVTQEPVLFAMTIEENIKYGRPNASREEVEAAARAANAHDFIMGLAEQYQTILGERGVSLSGGQKQRIAIARAIIKNPAVLLLDEATSALDTESEHLVQEALDRLMVGRTTLVIAHRLATIRNATKILVIHKGKVVETGSHDELLKIEDGFYTKLATRQMAFGGKTESTEDVPEIEL